MTSVSLWCNAWTMTAKKLRLLVLIAAAGSFLIDCKPRQETAEKGRAEAPAPSPLAPPKAEPPKATPSPPSGSEVLRLNNRGIAEGIVEISAFWIGAWLG